MAAESDKEKRVRLDRRNEKNRARKEALNQRNKDGQGLIRDRVYRLYEKRACMELQISKASCVASLGLLCCEHITSLSTIPLLFRCSRDLKSRSF